MAGVLGLVWATQATSCLAVAQGFWIRRWAVFRPILASHYGSTPDGKQVVVQFGTYGQLLEATEWEQHRCAHLSSQLFILVALGADDIVIAHWQRWR